MLFKRVQRATLCEAPQRFCKSVFKISHKLWFLRHWWWNPSKSRWGRDIPDISPLKVSSTQPRCHVVTYPFSGMIAAFATFWKKSYHPLWFGLCLTSRVLWWQQQKHARLKIYTHRNARSFWTLCSEICSCGKIEVTSHWRVWAQSCANLRIFFCRLACAQAFAYVDVRVSQLSSWQPTTIVHAKLTMLLLSWPVLDLLGAVAPARSPAERNFMFELGTWIFSSCLQQYLWVKALHMFLCSMVLQQCRGPRAPSRAAVPPASREVLASSPQSGRFCKMRHSNCRTFIGLSFVFNGFFHV